MTAEPSSISRQALSDYCSELLSVARIKDYAPNGLQVEGKSEISTIVTGVTASQALIDAAIDLKADAILVHHGYFWKGEPEPIVGMKQQRIKKLLLNDINLFGYHLPIDAHPELGNNAQLAKRLGITIEGTLAEAGGVPIAFYGQVEEQSGEAFAQVVEKALGRAPLHISVDKTVKSVGFCTGGAQNYINDAAAMGLDAYLSGEVSEHTVHTAREGYIHYYGAGHHATERYGIKALGEHLASQFNLTHHFVDIDNPV